jgi:hypothetical protein
MKKPRQVYLVDFVCYKPEGEIRYPMPRFYHFMEEARLFREKG